MIGLDTTPAINPLYRMQFEKTQACYVLLYPEGMIKLNGSAGEILQLVDGKLNVGQIIQALKKRFPDVDDIDADILEFLADADQRRWITVDQ